MRPGCKEHAKAVDGSTDIYKQVGNLWGDIWEEVGRFLHMFTGPSAEYVKGWLEGLVGWIKAVTIFTKTLGLQWDLFVQDLRLSLIAAEALFKKFLQRTYDSATGWWNDLVEDVPFFGKKITIGELDIAGDIGDRLKAAAEDYKAATKALNDAKDEAEAAMRGGGASTEGGPKMPKLGGKGPGAGGDSDAAAKLAAQVQQAKDNADILKATLQGMTDAEIAYHRTGLKLDRDHAEATKLLAGEKTRALGEAKLKEIELEKQLNEKQYKDANAAARRAFEGHLTEKHLQSARIAENEKLLREMMRELGRELDNEDYTYLREHLWTREEIQREFREHRELQEFVEQRRQLLEYERIYGKDLAAIR